MKKDKNLEKFFNRITDAQIALWPSSWGRLQCNATTADCKEYHSWAGRPEQKVTLEMIIDAFRLIGEQIE